MGKVVKKIAGIIRSPIVIFIIAVAFFVAGKNFDNISAILGFNLGRRASTKFMNYI